MKDVEKYRTVDDCVWFYMWAYEFLAKNENEPARDFLARLKDIGLTPNTIKEIERTARHKFPEDFEGE